MRIVKLKSTGDSVMIGGNNPIVVNCNVGINEESYYIEEIKKIDSLFEHKNTTPETMMDLSICKRSIPIAKYIIDTYKIPVGIVPIYTLSSSSKEISKNQLLDCIEMNAEDGVSFMTMHFTADKDIFHLAQQQRLIPSTSRGGVATLAEMNISGKTNNIFIENIDQIISLAIKYDFAISLGATFRPAGIRDACDKAHLAETNKQQEICAYIQSRGVDVIVENVGHINLKNISEHSCLLKNMNAPIMPLGPIPTDSAIGNDHIAAAIGAAFMGYLGCAHIINAISPSEHLNSKFTLQDLQQAIVAAKIAANTVNLCCVTNEQEMNNDIYNTRAKKRSCLTEPDTNCDRCDILCPLRMKI